MGEEPNRGFPHRRKERLHSAALNERRRSDAMVRSGLRIPWILLLSLLLVLALPRSAAGQGVGAEDRTAYLRLLSSYFLVPPMELEILLEGRIAMDELPVLLLLSRDTGMAPAAISATRRAGVRWMEVARRFGIGAPQLHVPLAESEVDERIRRAWNLFQTTDRRDWDRIELTDEEVLTLVHLKILSQHLGVSPGRVLEVRGGVGSWVEVPARLTRGR
jgi:hypothetical protein